MLELGNKEGHAKFRELLSKADVFVSNRRKGWRKRFDITPEETVKQRPGLIDVQITWAGETRPWSSRVGFDIANTLAWGLDNIEGSDEKPAHPSIYVACDYVAGWLATCGILSALLRRAKEGGATVSWFRCHTRLSGFLSWASSSATTRQKRPAQMMSTSIRIPIHSLSIRRWVAIKASRK